MRMSNSQPPSLRANGSGECPPDDRLREAIQSHKVRLDCFVASLLAMTWREHTRAIIPPRHAPEVLQITRPQKIRGRRKRRAPDGTRSPCAGNAHGGPQAPRHARRFLRNGFNGFLRALPGDEFLFVTVTERMSGLSRPGWANKTSAGLTSATDARTTRL